MILTNWIVDINSL